MMHRSGVIEGFLGVVCRVNRYASRIPVDAHAHRFAVISAGPWPRESLQAAGLAVGRVVGGPEGLPAVSSSSTRPIAADGSPGRQVGTGGDRTWSNMASNILIQTFSSGQCG